MSPGSTPTRPRNDTGSAQLARRRPRSGPKDALHSAAECGRQPSFWGVGAPFGPSMPQVTEAVGSGVEAAINFLHGRGPSLLVQPTGISLALENRQEEDADLGRCSPLLAILPAFGNSCFSGVALFQTSTSLNSRSACPRRGRLKGDPLSTFGQTWAISSELGPVSAKE